MVCYIDGCYLHSLICRSTILTATAGGDASKNRCLNRDEVVTTCRMLAFMQPDYLARNLADMLISSTRVSSTKILRDQETESSHPHCFTASTRIHFTPLAKFFQEYALGVCYSLARALYQEL